MVVWNKVRSSHLGYFEDRADGILEWIVCKMRKKEESRTVRLGA